MNEEIEKAVYRKAVGYDIQEICEEYSGENELIKRKVATKHFPPDITAVKAMVELGIQQEKELNELSDEELDDLKLRLIAQLKDSTKGEKNGNKKSNKQNKM